jgi:hypothetical protein
MTRSKRTTNCFILCLLLICSAISVMAQQAASTDSVVPFIMKFTGTLSGSDGKPLTGTQGATFLLYKEQTGGAPLWMETQNVQADKNGHYSVTLGSATRSGLPADAFSAGEARWLAVQPSGLAEQPRTLLVSVPYALKAADAETIGGLPPSAFVLATPPINSDTSNAPSSTSTATASASLASLASSAVTTTGGTVNALPLWTTATNVQSSAIAQTGAGAAAKIGIGTTAPASTLDVKGTETIRGALTLPATAAASPAAGKTSQPENLVASSFSSSTKTAVNQTFQWQAEPAANNTANPSGTLNLLYGLGAAKPAETGLKLSSKGIFTFAAGQTFPGTGPGTVKSVGLAAPASDFTVSGSPVTGTGTLTLAWSSAAPTSADVAGAIVKRDGFGSFTGTSIIGNTSNPGSAGIIGFQTGTAGYGVYGSSPTFAVWGDTTSGDGVVGNASGSGTGVVGQSASGTGVYGTGASYGVYATSSNAGGSGVGAFNTSTGDALFAQNQSGGFAAFFLGDVDVDGNLSKAAGSFKIDHPIDPANKYLYHSFVESPDMMNIYNGNVTTNAQGLAVVHMPEWFEALNRDFRYQLTVMGQFAQAIVYSKMAKHAFIIKTDKSNVEVSWQVTGVRHDAWADAHRIPVEVAKPAKERGSYLHPELFGAPASRSLAHVRHPELEKRPQPTSAHIHESTVQ